MKAVVTGGGTGGHIYPALAVAEALARLSPGADVRYVGGTRGMEAEIVPAHGLPFHAVTTRKLRKLVSADTVAVGLALLRGYRQAAAFLREFRPDVVIGTGGYVAGATVLAATRQRIPTVIQEQNAVAGRTNLWLSRWVGTICTSFEDTRPPFPAGRTTLTGVPIRPAVVSAAAKAEARSRLGLAETGFTVFAIGGSQGAQRVNETLVGALRHAGRPLQVLHQTGPRNYEDVVAASEGLPAGICYRPTAYLDAEQLPLAYRSADLVLCRCGASTLAEVTANGLPAILVPLPTAYADHQTANARALERVGAGILAAQGTLTAEGLAAILGSLAEDEQRLAAMAAASKGLGRIGAAEHVARIALGATASGGGE